MYPDAYVYYNIHHFHTDPTHWTEPDKFDPERFLSESPEDGTLSVVRPARFVPFGFGKRVCMGESLAKAELFLFATIMIQVRQGALWVRGPYFSPRVSRSRTLKNTPGAT